MSESNRVRRPLHAKKFQKFVGKYGEYRVLACLLEQGIEAYPAIKTNQADFDLTAILASGKVVRIQVKTREMSNKSTNNTIDHIDTQYDFLVIVIVCENENARFFIMTRAEALAIKGSNKQLGTTQQRKKEFQVKEIFLPHENKWEKISES